MSANSEPAISTVQEQARQTRRAAKALAQLSGDARNRILRAAAAGIEQRCAEIVAANQADCEAFAASTLACAPSQPLFKRLKTSESGVREMAMRVRDVAALPDPLGRVLATTELDEGLTLEKLPCPLGVIAVIFESRPDVVPQVGSLAIKTGNGLVLKGGAEARRTNRILVSILQDALASHAVDPEAICLLEERAEIMQVLQMEREIDLVVPRGSSDFVNFVFQHSRVPVMGHGSGICHIYVDRAADLAMAERVILDAKVQYPAACNSVEKVLIHKEVAAAFLPALVRALQQNRVEVRGCERTLRLCERLNVVPATHEDWQTEYSDLVLALKVVDNLDEALNHIEKYGSRHTESIITSDQNAAERFLNEVDAASVFHNASTRFADGYRYGLGAEIGVSNSKLHARGPVGLDGLLTYKYKLRGSGDIVADYAEGRRKFQHRRK
jgi:glutamate-5-semialdehyde dehydrogenase